MQVFRSFPTADNPTAGVHVKLHHFSTYRFTQAIAEHAVDERFIDAKWSRDWGIGMKDIKFNRGGRPYYVRDGCGVLSGGWRHCCERAQRKLLMHHTSGPVGLRRIGIKVPNFDERFGNWHVGFHGLQHETGLRGVLATGLKTPTQRNEDPQIHRISKHTTVFNIENFGDAVFFSPSHKYRLVMCVFVGSGVELTRKCVGGITTVPHMVCSGETIPAG